MPFYAKIIKHLVYGRIYYNIRHHRYVLKLNSFIAKTNFTNIGTCRYIITLFIVYIIIYLHYEWTIFLNAHRSWWKINYNLPPCEYSIGSQTIRNTGFFHSKLIYMMKIDLLVLLYGYTWDAPKYLYRYFQLDCVRFSTY